MPTLRRRANSIATEYCSRRATPSNPTTGGEQAGTDADTGAYLAQAFSDIELLVAVDVIKSAISERRKHVDPDALNRVLAKLTAAYNWKKRGAC